MFIVTLLLFRTLRHEGSGVDKACVDRLSPDLAASFSVSGAWGFGSRAERPAEFPHPFLFLRAFGSATHWLLGQVNVTPDPELSLRFSGMFVDNWNLTRRASRSSAG